MEALSSGGSFSFSRATSCSSEPLVRAVCGAQQKALGFALPTVVLSVSLPRFLSPGRSEICKNRLFEQRGACHCYCVFVAVGKLKVLLCFSTPLSPSVRRSRGI